VLVNSSLDPALVPRQQCLEEPTNAARDGWSRQKLTVDLAATNQGLTSSAQVSRMPTFGQPPC